MLPGLDRFFAWKPDYQQLVSALHVNPPLQLDFDVFKKGIDNIHLDVYLSAEFMERSQILVRKMLLHHVAENTWGEAPPPPDNRDVQAMKGSYAGIMERAVANASQLGQPQIIQLLQLSVLKFFLQLVDSEFNRLREQLRGAKGHESYDTTGKSVEAHDRLVVLAKKEPGIRYKIARKLFREILWVERTRGTKLRKSVLGGSWQLPKQILFNPMLQLPSLWADAQLMHHYPLICTGKDNHRLFRQMNQLVVGLFSDYLPDWCQPLHEKTQTRIGEIKEKDTTSFFTESIGQGGDLGINQIQRILGSALQREEYQQGLVSWLDAPQNLDRIFYSIRPGRRWRFEGSENIRPSPWIPAKWHKYYNGLLKRVFSQFKAQGLEEEVLACQMAPAIYKDLREQVPVRLICHYLAGTMKKKELQRRLATASVTLPQQAIIKVLDDACEALRGMSVQRRRKHILGFIHQFAQFRRDLKLAYHTHLALEGIRLLERGEDLDLSRNNDSLQEFVLRGELPPKRHQIRNHVIIKADVRGSTEMTAQLKQKGLNPATHFSLNFFEPITRLLPRFGAKKVFVEGDAVILSIFEYEDTPFQWLCVAHACGLAREMLKVVDAQNLKNHKYGLPDLELGLGIAFSDQSPAFLYDDKKEIMISSAINRSDQLSSSSAMIKRSGYARARGRGVEVFSLGQGQAQDKEASDRLARFNVNGIELDVAAFYKLRSEVTLKKISTRDAPYAASGEVYYAGRYPDMEGGMHWLTIRDAPVREWQGGSPVVLDQARRFYEVVTNDEVIRDLRNRAGSRNTAATPGEETTKGADTTKPYFRF